MKRNAFALSATRRSLSGYLTMLGLALPLLVAAQAIQIDTIGGTTYDWVANGTIPRMVFNDPAYGIHATWMFSADTGSSWPDRGMRYNFYDYSTGQWSFIDSVNYMASGVGVFPLRSGYGALDVNPANGCAYISCHYGTIDSLTPAVARDAAPGAGIFVVCVGEPNASGYGWPDISIDRNGRVQAACFGQGTSEGIYYTKVDPWCNWAVPVQVNAGPTMQDQCIVASGQSDKVLISWVDDPFPLLTDALHYRLSTDGGANWDSIVTPAPPQTFGSGSDSTPVFFYTSSALWDNQDEFHLTVPVFPVVDNQGLISPCEIWDYSPARTPAWSRVTRAYASKLDDPCEWYARLACRPSLSTDADGNLFCVWEQFDSISHGNPGGFLSGGIMASASTDNGLTWCAPIQLTPPITSSDSMHSYRYPTIARYVDDYVHVICMDDLCTGIWSQGGPGFPTNNPYLYMKVRKDTFPNIGISEQALPGAKSPRPLGPTLVRGIVTLPPRSPAVLLDISGRKVLNLRPGANDVRALAPGVYFIRTGLGTRGVGLGKTQKVVLTE